MRKKGCPGKRAAFDLTAAPAGSTAIQSQAGPASVDRLPTC
jgi:hypothetical protein